jgi:hypothetical protein
MAFSPKWLVRTGALLVMLGFFLPSMMVSCSVLGSTAPVGEFSIAQLADASGYGMNNSSLYLVFVCSLLALVATFISYINRDLAKYEPMVEAAFISLSLLVLIFKMMSVNSQLSNGAFKIDLRYGAFILLIGYIMAIVGVIMDFSNGEVPSFQSGFSPGRMLVSPEREPPTAHDWAVPVAPPVQARPMARLEVINGNLHTSMVRVIGPDFSIGRGATNDFVIPDQKVSRTHVRLRFAQGTWFLQDQNSSLGTYVNGQKVQAGRLNPGDQLKIGDIVFVFQV